MSPLSRFFPASADMLTLPHGTTALRLSIGVSHFILKGGFKAFKRYAWVILEELKADRPHPHTITDTDW